MHMNVNRNKRSVTLNLKRPEAREALMRLVDDADVFVHSMRPSAAKRLGISYHGDCRAQSAHHLRVRPRLSPGWAARDDPAFDDVVQGESGIAALMAQVIGEPRYYPTVIIDKFCGYILASSIGMALFNRERTGQGQEVHVPMYETILELQLSGASVERGIRSAAGPRRRLCAPAHDASASLPDQRRLHLCAGGQRRSMEPAFSRARSSGAGAGRALRENGGARPALRRALRHRGRSS